MLNAQPHDTTEWVWEPPEPQLPQSKETLGASRVVPGHTPKLSQYLWALEQGGMACLGLGLDAYTSQPHFLLQ